MPGLLIDGEPVHGSRAILARLEQLVPDPTLYPEPLADAVAEADFQIGATLRVLLTVGDLRPLIEGRPAEGIARRWFPDYPGDIPAGAYPAGWVRQAA